VADDPERKSIVPRLSIETVIILATLFAGLAGQWAIFGTRAGTQQDQINELREDSRAQAVSIYKLDNRLSVLESRLDYLNNTLQDLRRQARLNPSQP
jgi:TolA-binding protein